MRKHDINETILQKYAAYTPNDKFEQLAPEVWIWRNFISKEECREIIEEALLNEWEYRDKTKLERLSKLSEKLSTGFDKAPSIQDFEFVRTFKEEMGMAPHADIYGWQNRMIMGVVGPDHPGETVDFGYSTFSTLIYYNDDFEGGELVYPEYEIEYKPCAGDLLIHTPEVIHGVKKVKSGIRYSSQANIDQRYLIDKDFYENFRHPAYEQDLQLIQNGKMSEDGDFHFDALAPVIANERLRKWADTQENFLAYCGAPGEPQ